MTPPFFLPAITLALVVSILVSGPVSRALGTSRPVASLLGFGVGLIVASTLTPRALFGPGGSVHPTCDFSRLGLPSWQELLSIYDAGGNILMFIPLGVAIGLLPGSRARRALAVGAVLSPFVIEATQLLVPPLERACQSGDVVDNLIGLALGFAAGLVLSRIAARVPGRVDRRTN